MPLSVSRFGSDRRGASPGPADAPDLPAFSSAAEELIAAIGLEPRHVHSGRHLQLLEDLSGSRIDSPQFALVTFPGAVPEFTVDPGDAGHEVVGLDREKDRPRLGIDLMDVRARLQSGMSSQCTPCCANPMVILLAVGVMDLRAIAVVTAAITSERLAPAGERVAQAIGIVVVGAGLILIAQAGLG